MSRAQAEEQAQKVADEMIAALEAGTASWVRPWAPGEAFGTAPFNAASGRRYKGGNAIYLGALALARGYKDPRWLTYKQATELGAQVRKGEKSVTIEYWNFPSKPGASEEEPGAEPEAKRAPWMRPSWVFNAAQVDGLKPLPALPVPTWATHAEAEAVVQRLGVPVTHAGGEAFYSPAQDRIQMPPPGLFRDQDGYYSTLLHECGHATGHPSRLNRDMSSGYGTPGYAAEELRAELSSMLLAQRLGTSHDPSQHHAYVASWIKLIRDKPRELFAAARDAEAICEYLGVGLDYDLTARAALLGGEEHAHRLGAESQAATLRQQRDQAAALLASTPSPTQATPARRGPGL